VGGDGGDRIVEWWVKDGIERFRHVEVKGLGRRGGTEGGGRKRIRAR